MRFDRLVWAAGLLIGIAPSLVTAQTPASRSADADALRVQAERLQAGPSSGPPRTNVTSFDQALRCMDGMFRAYGIKGTSVVLEEIPDATSKVRVGAKDMFMSASSRMTRASRAIRLIPWDKGAIYSGRDDVLKAASFAVQGSISQFDDAMLRKQRDGAICLGPLCIGAAESDSFSGMSLDLNVIETESLTLMPGVTSKNYVLVRRKGRGLDGDLSLKKFGVQYNFTFTSSDGQGQAMRSLVELSVIELYGRLHKIPYWQCLGLTDSDPGVQAEIDDWWESLRAEIPKLLAYFQTGMSARGLYKGNIDGELSDELKRALRAYKLAMGRKDDLNFDAEFFRHFLASDHPKLEPIAVARLSEITSREGALPPPEAKEPPASTAGLGVRLEGTRGKDYVYKRGETVEVEAQLARAGFLYCFMLDENRQLIQFFPNAARRSAAVAQGEKMLFPGPFPFRLLASQRGAKETVACAATSRDLGADALPDAGTVRDLEALRQALGRRLGQNPEIGVFDVKVQ